jgi:hypothetical protein
MENPNQNAPKIDLRRQTVDEMVDDLEPWPDCGLKLDCECPIGPHDFQGVTVRFGWLS